MATVAAPLAFVIAGGLAYGISNNPKVHRISEMVLFVGLFWLCALLSGHAWHF